MKKDSLSISSVFKPTERYKTISWMGGEVCAMGGGKVSVYGVGEGERFMFMGGGEEKGTCSWDEGKRDKCMYGRRRGLHVYGKRKGGR